MTIIDLDTGQVLAELEGQEGEYITSKEQLEYLKYEASELHISLIEYLIKLQRRLKRIQGGITGQ